MAGRERSGFAASSRRPLSRVRLDPDPRRQAAGAARVVAGLARAWARGRCVLPPAAHDRAVAFLSHLPQIVAWALARAAARRPRGARGTCASPVPGSAT